MKYSLAFVCISFLLAQAYANTVPIEDVSDEVPIDGIIDEVKKAFAVMMKAINKALTFAQSALDKAMNTVDFAAMKVTGKAKSEIAGLTGGLQKKLDGYVQKAAALGLDVTACQTYVDQFAAIPNKTIDGVVGCITTQVVKAKGYSYDALANCKKIAADLAHVGSEIDDCRGNVMQQAKCYAKLLKYIVGATVIGPKNIMKDVTKTTALVTNIVPILELCEINQVKRVGTTAAKLVLDFATCAGLTEY